MAFVMAMDPIRARLGDRDIVSETGARWDGALGYHRRTIHLVVSNLEESMGVQGRWLIELVNDIDDQGVV